jgi:hypothetical protein
MIVGVQLIPIPLAAAIPISSSSSQTMCAPCTRGERKPIASRYRIDPWPPFLRTCAISAWL